MIDIGKRLTLVADLLGEGELLADVGCDHAYLPIYMLETKRVNKAIAMDVAQGPLNIANYNINTHGYKGVCSTRISNGIDKLNIGEADLLSICGMGGGLISQILENGKDKLNSFRRIVIEPQSEVYELLDKLVILKLKVIEEAFIKDRNKYYPVFVIEYTENTNKHFYGKTLLENNDFREYVIKRLNSLRNVLVKIENSNNNPSHEVLREIEHLAKLEKMWN